MLALLLREQFDPTDDSRLSKTSRLVLTAFTAWMAAYLAMWLAKLALTSALTSENAFIEAFSRVCVWVFKSTAGRTGLSTIPLALFYCAINLVDLVPLVMEGALLIGYVVHILRKHP